MLAAQLEMAQQYNRSPRGYPPLQQWARDHVQRLHAPPAGHELLVTLGGNHAAEVRSVQSANAKPGHIPPNCMPVNPACSLGPGPGSAPLSK